MIQQKLLKMCRSGSAAVVFGVILLWSFSSFAQNISVSGTVTDAKGETLPGVSVLVKGTRIGTSTDIKGKYTLKGVPAEGTLVFSFMGYKPREIAVKSRRTIDAGLEEDVKSLDEVVVVGYGSVRKSHLTGSVTKLKNENLDEIPTSRLDNALIGKMAGVSVQNTTSEAGAAPTVRVRGLSSISANSSPLIVVDGHPVPDGLAFVNPYDVESIEVLKDAASSAIYGSRGANGVIIITTRKGTANKPRYAVKSYYGFKDTYKLNPIMSITEYTKLLYSEADLRRNDASVNPADFDDYNDITPNERAAYILENQIAGASTDWQDEALHSAGIYNVQLNASGGNKDLRYYVSGNVQRDQGIMKFSENNKGNFKVKLDANLSKKISLSVNLNPTYSNLERPGANFTDYYRTYSFLPVRHSDFTAAFVNQNPQWASVRPGDWAQARHFANMYYSGYMPDGSYWTSNETLIPWGTSNNSPLSIASRISRSSKNYRVMGGGDISYNIVKGLTFKTAFSGYYNNREDLTLTRSNAKSDGDVSSGEQYTNKTIDLLWENTLNYSRQVGNHNFTGLLGYTVQKTTSDASNILARNFPTDDFETLSQAAQIDQAGTYTNRIPTGLVSYLGRITYDYKGRYLFSTSLRTDGSTYFKKPNQWGWFPSVSAGWRVNTEPFMKGTSNWLSNLKLRASYGATGNNRIQDFAYENLLYPGNYSFGGGTGTLNLGLAPNGDVLANPYITWERTFELNTGLDLGLFKDRLSLSMELYRSETDRLLFQQGTMSFSGSNTFWNNAGKVRNTGVEIDLTSNNISSKKFQWSTNLNLAANSNKLMQLGGEPFQYTYGERNEVYAAIVGKPSIQFFGYKTDGVWMSKAEVDEAKNAGQTAVIQNYYTPGGIKVKDINGDNRIDENDRTTLGTPFPDFTWGITNSMKYKGFDLSFLIQGVQGGNMINGDAFYTETKRLNSNYTKNRWISPANPGDGKTPYNNVGGDWMLTDYVMENASYASLRNVIIGYTFPAKLIGKAKINTLRVYASGDNLVFITGDSYRGINPEARVTSNQYASPLTSGYQRGAFPVTRTFTFGIDFTF
ncbi:SusC/RagA family TonB-linked outer membrane protein [Arcticibacter tournemirensis]|nr:TonB-dependent receptor [Arcticibacter tournemirensis]